MATCAPPSERSPESSGWCRSATAASKSPPSACHRISVLEWLADDPYPRGDVEAWPEAEPVDGAALLPELDRLHGRVEETRRLAREVAKAGRQQVPTRAAPPLKLSDDVGRAVYQLAARAPIGPADRYRLLAAPTIEARVELLGAALDDTDAMLRFRLA